MLIYKHYRLGLSKAQLSNAQREQVMIEIKDRKDLKPKQPAATTSFTSFNQKSFPAASDGTIGKEQPSSGLKR